MSFGLPFVGGVVWLWPWSWPTDGLTFVCFPSLFRRYTDYCESSQGLRRRDHARHRPLLGPLIRYLTARYSASGLLRCLPRRVEHLQKKQKTKKKAKTQKPKRKPHYTSRPRFPAPQAPCPPPLHRRSTQVDRRTTLKPPAAQHPSCRTTLKLSTTLKPPVAQHKPPPRNTRAAHPTTLRLPHTVRFNTQLRTR
jgi:hypothetical protein